MDRAAQNEVKVPKRVLNTLLSALTAGVVPRSGAPYIAIGRQDEIRALSEDLETAKEGGAAVRFLIGRYGSGKSFLIQLMRGYAMDRNFLCADADLSPERRLTGGSGAGVATYRELIRSLACKASPDGEALSVLLAKQDAEIGTELAKAGVMPEDASFAPAYRRRVFDIFSELESGVGGFDFCRVVTEYFFALRSEDEGKKSACLRWLRGEFANKTEARSALGFQVSAVIDDDSWYEVMKLWARLATRLGYAGLLVCIDECINLYKIPNRISRESNYEKLLTIFNDALQGRAKGLCVIFGGTPQFLEDPRRGLFSYEALRSRLVDSQFAAAGYTTLASPVIRLRRLSDNELLALLNRLVKLLEQQSGAPARVTPEDMASFLETVMSRAGAEEMLTPRDVIRDFLTVMYVLRDHPELTFSALVQKEREKKADAPREEKSAPPSGGASLGGVMPEDFEF